MEKIVEVLLLQMIRKLLKKVKPGEVESLVVLAASDICYQLRKEAHKINAV